MIKLVCMKVEGDESKAMDWPAQLEMDKNVSTCHLYCR